MPRRKPISGKKRKEQQQRKRAIKRGDLPPPDPKAKPLRKRRPARPAKSIGQPNPDALVARRLQSSFIKLPSQFLEETRYIASTVPLARPISCEVALFHTSAADNEDVLSCPKRPKWRFDMSKTEVEHNEEGVFRKWLVHTDQLLEEWQKTKQLESPGSSTDQAEDPPNPPLLASPTYFERNIEIWRQLWRVSEISHIILVLLDSRCPLLHYPPSLANYLANLKTILVLTKVDITGPARVSAWMNYFNTHYPDLRIIQVESYAEREATTGHQGRKQFEPHLPETFRQRLVDAIKEVHAEMLEPPKHIAENPESLKKWVPPVKREVDWNRVLNASGGQVGSTIGGAVAPKPKAGEEVESKGEDSCDNQEPDVLTIGLIGQPNVGKSSLLNALFGTRRSQASKTPGKTKHFQTLYWTSDVRLVDCPGLVMPNYMPMETQVLSGILPISKVSAIPACISRAAKLLPLEQIYKLNHPASSEPPVEDKRTWREEKRPPPQPKPVQWTAMDILLSYANAKGWLTAMAGRPDIHRAGNAILRGLAEGRIGWAFWPPDTSLELVAKESIETGAGIWIPGRNDEDRESDNESEEEIEVQESDVSEEIASSEEEDFPGAGAGIFSALHLDGDGSDDESEEDEEPKESYS